MIAEYVNFETALAEGDVDLMKVFLVSMMASFEQFSFMKKANINTLDYVYRSFDNPAACHGVLQWMRDNQFDIDRFVAEATDDDVEHNALSDIVNNFRGAVEDYQYELENPAQ